MKIKWLCPLLLSSMVLCAPTLRAQTPNANSVYSKDFVAGFKKGSNEARAYNEASTKELDATFNFSKYAVDGLLPPALRSENKNAPAIFRCGKTGSVEERFAVIAPAQPLCKTKNANGACTHTFSWRDLLLEDLAPPSPVDETSVLRAEEFKKGEDAAKDTALDNMRILSELYVGMGTYRALEACTASPQKALNSK